MMASAVTYPMPSARRKTARRAHLTLPPSAQEMDAVDSRDAAKSKQQGSSGTNGTRQPPPPDPSRWTCITDFFGEDSKDGEPSSWCGTSYMSKTNEPPNSPTRPFRSKPISTNASDISALQSASESSITIKLDDHSSRGQLDDGESIESVSTLGTRAFGDLNSLPSVGDSILPLKHDFDDGSTIGSIGDFSIPTIQEVKSAESDADGEPIVWDTSSIGSGNTFTSETLENAVDEKLNKVNADETIGDTLKSEKELVRTTSSISHRSLAKRKMAVRLEKIASDTSSVSKAHSVLSSDSTRTKLVRELRTAMENHGRYHIQCAHITTSLAATFEEEKEYGQAVKLHRDVVAIYSTKLGDHHATTIDAKIRLAKLLEKVNDYDRAIELYFNVLCMRKATCGETDSTVPDTLSFISQALKRKGRSTQAIKELKRALKMYRAALGDAHPRVTATVDEISALYVAVGDYEKATAILEEVVKLKAATVGINNVEVAKTLVELATAYEAGGENTKALRSLKKSYTIYTTVHGESSEEATNVLERIAMNYKTTLDRERCVAAYLGVLRGRKDFYGDTHSKVANTYLQLGIALRENKQLEKAMKCMKQSLSIYVGEGKDMNDVNMIAEVMHEMALIHCSKQQLTDALKIFKQELTIRQKMGGRQLHQTAVTLHHLGTTELEMRNHTKALNYFMEALQIYEKTNEEIGIDFGETLYCTGIVFDATRHTARAKEAYQEAINVFETQGLTAHEVRQKVAKLDRLKALNVEKVRGKRQRKPGNKLLM